MPHPQGEERLPQSAQKFIPHSGRMCVIGDLLEVIDDSAVAEALVQADSPFLRQDGTLEECIFVEMIAQTTAAGNGFKISAEKRKTQKGYLLGAKKLKIHGTARLGDRLKIKTHKSAGFGDFGIIEGSVMRGEEILAEGEIKVVQFFEENAPAGINP